MSIFSVMEETENNGQNVIWDYADVESPHPFFISALAIYKDSLKELIKGINISDSLRTQLSSAGFISPVELYGETKPEIILEQYKNTLQQ